MTNRLPPCVRVLRPSIIPMRFTGVGESVIPFQRSHGGPARTPGAEERYSLQREVRLRRLRPVQTRTAINRTKAAPRTMSQASSTLRPLAMAWLIIRCGFVVVVGVESTKAR
jgi:hypothetical protein